jgi:hypothetical protein
MKIKYIQVDVREEINSKNWSKPDYRQAEYVLKYKPDIIIFESPMNKTSDTIYNKYSCDEKPLKIIQKYKKELIKNSKKPGNGDALSDIRLFDNIMALWKTGHNVLIYNVDAPNELRAEFFEVWKYMYPSALKNWLWWIRIYLREKYMVKNIQWILEKNKNKDSLTVAIFLQGWHWKHVKFLLSDPTKNEIWKYYFSKFKEVNEKNITEKVKKENKVFYKYWLKMSDFA